MPDISKHIGYTYIEYSAAFHMKYKHLFIDKIYDTEYVDKYPLIITWAETDMEVDEESGRCLAIAAKTMHYPDKYKLSEGVFEDLIQAFIIFPESDVDTNELRLSFARALLTK